MDRDGDDRDDERGRQHNEQDRMTPGTPTWLQEQRVIRARVLGLSLQEYLRRTAHEPDPWLGDDRSLGEQPDEESDEQGVAEAFYELVKTPGWIAARQRDWDAWDKQRRRQRERGIEELIDDDDAE